MCEGTLSDVDAQYLIPLHVMQEKGLIANEQNQLMIITSMFSSICFTHGEDTM